MFAEAVNHRQASRGNVQDQDCQDMGPAVVQNLEMLLLGSVLRTLLQIAMYDRTISSGTRTTMRMSTAHVYIILNAMPAHSSLTRSWCRQ